MSKAGKRVKSGTNVQGGGTGPKWEVALQTLPFEESSWKPSLTIIIPNRHEDISYLKILHTAIQSGLRKLFTLITPDVLYAEVRELGNPKVKKGKDVPANYEICEVCKPILDAGEELPPPLLAKLVKYKLLTLKTNDIRRREAEKKAAQEKEKAKLAGDKGGKERSKSPKKGGKKTPEPQAAKEGSKLKKRGEEDSVNRFLDDEPDDGAHHYFILSGFRTPYLLTSLEEIGVAVDSIIRFRSQDYMRFQPAAHAEPEIKDEKTLAQEEATRKDNERTDQELAVFWRDMPLLLKRQPEGAKLQDTARLEYEVKNLIVPANLEDTDPKILARTFRSKPAGGSNQQPSPVISFGATMFDDISSMIYDLLDAKRLYHTYLENLKLIHVPATLEAPSTTLGPDGQSQSSAPTPSGVPVAEGGVADGASTADMRYYNDLMNSIPNESVSVPLILHCMLEQVVATEEGREPPSEEVPPPRSDGMSYDLFAHLSGLAAKLALTPEEHETLATAFELPRPSPPASKQPLILSCHDDIAKRTHHLKTIYGFNAQETERKMLNFIPFHSLAELPSPHPGVTRERAGRLQELIHHLSVNNLHYSEIDWAMKQFVFECMDLITTDPNGFLLTREGEGAHHHEVPWDDPYPFYRGMVPRHHTSNMVLPRVLTAVRSGAVTPSLSERDSDLLLPRSSSRTQTPTSPLSAAGSKKGILRAQSACETGEGEPRRNSVFFDIVQVEKEQEVHIPPLNEDEDEELSAVAIDAGKTLEESHMDVVDSQQRTLDQWCFAEHFEPHVMMQVLRTASYVLPYVDLYHNRRDNSIMVVLHCPHNPDLQLHMDWHCELHSNLGFRNYLENVAESIADWLKEKEAEYQAKLLSDEVKKMREDEEAVAKAAAKGTQKDRGKSPKKSPSRSKSPKGAGSRGSSANVSPSPSNPYIRAGSLKAMKEEQERLKAEEEEKDKQKKDNRKSPRKDKNADKEDKDKDKEDTQRSRKDLSGSRASNKSHLSRELEITEDVSNPPGDEKYWPFSGYDMGNQMIHVSGITTTLFPSDGGQIRTERIDYVQGSTCIKTSVLKDGHVFTVHIMDPLESKDDEDEPSKPFVEIPKVEEGGVGKEEAADQVPTPKEGENAAGAEGSQPQTPTKPPPPAKKSISFFGSLTAQLVDGMTFALSQHGATGEAADLRRPEPEPMPVPPPVASPLPPASKESPSKGKGKDKGKERPPPTPEPPSARDRSARSRSRQGSTFLDTLQDDPSLEVEEEPIPVQPFQQVNVTGPDGLSVAFFLESSVGIRPTSPEDRRLVVRQSYPYKTSGQQPCESLRKKYALTEASRVITSEGTVIKNMMDGSVEVLYADSTVSLHTGPWNPPSRSGSPVRESSARSTRLDMEAETAEKSKKVGKSATKHGQKGQAATNHAPEPVAALEESAVQRGTWVTTYPSGDKIIAAGDQVEEGPSVMISVASDPETRQSMATRDDHVVTVSYPDGTTIVEHSDGTRITTYYRQAQTPIPQADADETGESPQYELRTVKFVKVECPAYATVEFNCSTSENLTIFGNGTTFNVFPDGYYMIHQLDGSKIEVDTEGSVVYFPRQNQQMEQLLPAQEGHYILRHNAEVVVETTDPEGNVFNVRANGDFKVTSSNGEEIQSFDSGEVPVQQQTAPKKVDTYLQHSPRFFIVYPDGSGLELLRWQDIADYMAAAEQSSATAILREPLNDFPGVTGITVLKPYVTGISDLWLKKYDMDSIVPRGIRNRDLTTLPPRETKKPGPAFGTAVGKGLAISSTPSALNVRIPILRCPDILEVRQILQRKPISENLRQTLRRGLKAYADEVMRRQRMSHDLQVLDPRSESERMLAADLASLSTPFPQDKVCLPEGDIKDIYEKATAPPPLSPPPTPQAKRTEADWERDQRELAEEALNRKALRGKLIPPYFESELGKAFLLTQAKDMEEMLKELSEDPRRDGTEAVRADTASADFRESKTPGDRTLFQSTLPTSERSEIGESPMNAGPLKAVVDTPLSYSGIFSEMAATPSALRPGNPTPAHATGQGSPAPLRPKNPTPAHASKVVADRPINPTPKLAGGLTDSPSEFSEHPYQRSEYPMIPEQPMEEERTGITPEEDADLLLTRSLRVNVVGEPRRDPVLLPPSIKGGRPGAMPNHRFQAVEDPVRRKVNNCVTAGSGERALGQLGLMRGLILLPEEVDFGVLREGNTYMFTVYLKNTGVDTCRFKISQPPPATGIRVFYKPGPIPAGLRTELNLEIYAIAVGVTGESGVGSIVHDLKITTETDVLTLPIKATVLTGYEYDHRSLQTPRGGKSAGTRLVATKPPSSTGIIRPRRELLTGMSM